MQHIQWFPGHMTSAIRMMEDEIKLIDGIVYVLDARAAFACINQKLNKIFNNKPILYVLNKCDMIERFDVSKITKEFLSKGNKIVATVGNDKRDCLSIVKAVKEMLSEKMEKDLKKGINKALRVMVVGIPNTGKSTIINTITGGKRAKTGDKAGVTRDKQWIRTEGFEMLDTPGTMPPSFENQIYAKHLAYIGCINDDILDLEDLCFELIKDLIDVNVDIFQTVYRFDAVGLEPIEIFDKICLNRGYIKSGNNLDYERCSKAVIDDLRKLKLGKICFEKEQING